MPARTRQRLLLSPFIATAGHEAYYDDTSRRSRKIGHFLARRTIVDFMLDARLLAVIALERHIGVDSHASASFI